MGLIELHNNQEMQFDSNALRVGVSPTESQHY